MNRLEPTSSKIVVLPVFTPQTGLRARPPFCTRLSLGLRERSFAAHFLRVSLDIAGEKMKFMNALGLGVTAGLLAVACSSSNSPSSSSTAVATGASTGTTMTGSSAGAASGTTATAGTSSGSATMPEASTTEEASADTDSAADAGTSATMLVAACNTDGSAYNTNTTGTAFEAQDFCTLFISICSQLVAVTALSVQATCEMTYAGWTPAQQECRTYDLCIAAGGTADESPNCWNAQGYAAPVANGASALAGGPCP